MGGFTSHSSPHGFCHGQWGTASLLKTNLRHYDYSKKCFYNDGSSCSSPRPGPSPKPGPSPRPPSPAPHCSDAPPDTKYTCAQQKDFGKCGASWMKTLFKTYC